MKNSLVSIIVPIYNASDYMCDCINSIINQTYKEIELILVNDGSCDNSLEICEAFAQKDSRIKIINQENYGPGIARNNGIDNCSGEFVVFVDSDDTLVDYAIEKLINEICDNDCDVVQCRAQKVTEDGKILDEYWKEEQIVMTRAEAMSDYLNNNIPILRFAVWAKIYRRNAIGSIRFPDIKNSEDVVFNCNVIDNIEKVGYIKDILYNVNVREGSQSRSGLKKDKIKGALECSNLILKVIKSKEEYASLISRAKWSAAMTAVGIARQAYQIKCDNYQKIIKDMSKEKCILDLSLNDCSLVKYMSIQFFKVFPKLYLKVFSKLI